MTMHDMTTPNEFTRDILPPALRDFNPEWAVVLGSGLGPFVDALDVTATLPFDQIPGLPVSTVPGHAGRFVFGKIGGTPVVVAQGRVHLYEGRSARNVAAGVRFLAACGARRLVLTNAAGSANPGFAPGSWMLLTDHLNLTGTSPLLGGPNFFDMSEAWSEKLRRHFARTAADIGITLHEGVYAGLTGPQYETPAEVRMLRLLGADAVGMSTVIEAIQARALGLEIAGFSCMTNWAAGISPQPLSHGEVIETGRAAAGTLVRILEKGIASQPRA
jgi:purine-nucleoside phosphorylase